MKFLLHLVLITLAGGLYSQTEVQNVDALTFKKIMDEHKSIIIDLRTDEEIEKKGMIKSARQIDYLSKNAETKIETLNRDSTYLIYCAGGGRSEECTTLMKKLGFKHVVNLEKGFSEWKARGLETIKR